MKSQCIAVPTKETEKIRRALMERGIMRKDLAITKHEGVIYLPIALLEEKNILGYEVVEREFELLEKEISNYKELVNIPERLRPLLPSSFDMIGKIAIIKLADEMLTYKEVVCEAILKANKSIETVAIDAGIDRQVRVRQLEIAAGKRETDTIHKEYGISLEIDPSKVYFSPRLATERWRVAQMVEEGEVVIDMFCGVGPFSILMAKHRKPGKIYALDVNKDAINYLKKNIERNKVSNILALHGDSKVLVPDLESADRIIMNLPFSSFEFLPVAFANIKRNGIIHYYEILDHDKKDDRYEDIQEVAKEQDIKLVKLLEKAVHTYSPGSDLFCFDLNKIRG
jgi:tRNA (guanine37-N1)-methyltransferase